MNINNILDFISSKSKKQLQLFLESLLFEFKENLFDYRAYIFYSEYFTLYDDGVYNYKDAKLVLNSILNFENCIEPSIEFIAKPKIIYHDNGGYSVTYINKKHENRIDINDLHKKNEILNVNNAIEDLYIKSATINSLNYKKIQQDLVSIPNFKRSQFSKFEYLSDRDQKLYYDFFMYLLKIHFQNEIIETKKEIIITKLIDNKYSIEIYIDKKVLFKELKLGRLKINLINSKSVNFIYLSQKYPINIFFPSSSFYFPITDDLEKNLLYIKRLDVFLSSVSFFLDNFTKIIATATARILSCGK